MFNNLSFLFTVLSYFALLIFNLQKFNGNGESLMGAGFFGFAIIASYTLCSLMLTISVTRNGGFDWISNVSSTRNIAVGVLWFGMVLGVVFCTIIRMEFRASNEPINLQHYLSLPIYYGATWLPLLMLVPYAILLNPEWRTNFSPFAYKLPLFAACILGFVIYSIPKIIANISRTKSAEFTNESEYAFNQTMNKINNENSITGLLDFTNSNIDEKLRNAALTKIKQDKNLEAGLVKGLEENSFIDADVQIFEFLANNKIDHPNLLVAAINDAILRKTSQIQIIINDPEIGNEILAFRNVEVLCGVLEINFKESSQLFRPNMLKLQEILESKAAKRSDGDNLLFDETLNKYRLSVKNWLAKN